MCTAARKTRTKKRRFRPFLGLVSWWNRRNFYFAQREDPLDDESMLSQQKSPNKEATKAPLFNLPKTAYFRRPTEMQQQTYPSTINRTVDSFQDSVESMDSVVDSYWDPGDETSQATAVASNSSNTLQDAGYPKDFLAEHLNFLSAQTQPRAVELVYKN
jgi:hypothetical protein